MMRAEASAKRARIASGAACSTSRAPDQDAPCPGTALEREMERTLRDFVRLRTVSADPGAREDCFRGAKFLAALLESLGARSTPLLIHCFPSLIILQGLMMAHLRLSPSLAAIQYDVDYSQECPPLKVMKCQCSPLHCSHALGRKRASAGF